MPRKPDHNYKELYRLYEEFKEANPKKGTIRDFCSKLRMKYAGVQKAFKRLEKKEVTKTDIKRLDDCLTDNKTDKQRTNENQGNGQTYIAEINPKGKDIYERRIEPQLKRVEMMYFDGALDIDVYTYFNLSSTTWYEYCNKHPELREAVELGKSYSDYEVEKALYNTAIGNIEVEETKSSITADGTPRIDKTVKQVPPNVTAQRYWLGNRKAKKWHERRDPNEIRPEDRMADISDEELDKEIEKLQKG